jgi:RHS repeat-associated protein
MKGIKVAIPLALIMVAVCSAPFLMGGGAFCVNGEGGCKCVCEGAGGGGGGPGAGGPDPSGGPGCPSSGGGPGGGPFTIQGNISNPLDIRYGEAVFVEDDVPIDRRPGLFPLFQRTFWGYDFDANPSQGVLPFGSGISPSGQPWWRHSAMALFQQSGGSSYLYLPPGILMDLGSISTSAGWIPLQSEQDQRPESVYQESPSVFRWTRGSGISYYFSLPDQSGFNDLLPVEAVSRDNVSVRQFCYSDPLSTGVGTCKGLFSNDAGVPYLRTITDEYGSVLALTWAATDGGYLLSNLALNGTTVATYSYDSTGLITADLGSSSGGPKIQYAQTLFAADGGITFQRSVGGTVISQKYWDPSVPDFYTPGNSDEAVVSAQTLPTLNEGQNWSVGYDWTGGLSGLPEGYKRHITDSHAQLGDGVHAATGWSREYYVNDGTGADWHGGETVAVRDACDAGCSPGTAWYVAPFSPISPPFACANGNTCWSTREVIDKQGHTTVQQIYDRSQDPPYDVICGGIPGFGDAGFLPCTHQEILTEIRGALTVDAGETGNTFTGGVTRNYTYSYNSDLRTPSFGDWGQRMKTETEPSVMDGGTVTTQWNYDSCNRVVSKTRTGVAEVWTGSAFQQQEQTRATVYTYASSTCPDTNLDQPIEIDGPCSAASASSTSCSQAAGTYRQEARTYYSTSGNNDHRLDTVTVYPAGKSGSVSLLTTYASYDIWGHPGTITDPNGICSQLTWTAATGKLASVQLGSSCGSGTTTSFNYDQGELMSIQKPKGNYLVLCHRNTSTAFSSGSCTSQSNITCNTSTGAFNPLVQFIAKSENANGSSAFEWVELLYWPDGQIKEENFCNSSGIQGMQQYADDVHHRRTRSALGSIATGSGSATSQMTYNHDDDLAASLAPFSNAQSGLTVPTCTVESFASVPCDVQRSYDTLERLTQVTSYSGTDAGVGNIGFRYDTDDNVTAETIIDGGVTPRTYLYDDFGDLVQYCDENFSACTKYGYNGSGYLLAKQASDMASSVVQYNPDALGRPTNVTFPDAGYALEWDVATTAPGTNCASTALTKGRLAARNDSYGWTWYQYDNYGKELREIRTVEGSTGTACPGLTDGGLNGNLDTIYTYDNNENVATIAYAHGAGNAKRLVTYNYGNGSSADADRVTSISASVGSSGTSATVIDTITWFPFGGLAGYRAIDTSNSTYDVTAAYAVSSSTGLLSTLTLTQNGTAEATLTYTWTGDQVTKVVKHINTGWIAGFQDKTENYTYDLAGRLSGATNTSFTTTGGAFATRAYGFTPRGDRGSETMDNGDVKSNSSTGFLWNLVANSSKLSSFEKKTSSLSNFFTSTPDNQGRETQRSFSFAHGGQQWSTTQTFSPLDSTLTSAYVVSGPVGTSPATWQYSYDAFGRRWAKVYPVNSMRDEYFRHYDGSILEDFGFAGYGGASPYPVYDYIWLDGKPLATLRSTLSDDFQLRTDSATSTFTRQWPEGVESVNCGTYVSFFDHIGRPFLAFQASASTSATSVAWEGDWDPEGHVNRVQAWQETAHPYANGADAGVGVYNEPGAQWYRVHFGGFDTENCHDVGYITDLHDNQQSCQKGCRTCTPTKMAYSGNNGGFWTCQLPVPDGGFEIFLNSDSANQCRNGTNCSCCDVSRDSGVQCDPLAPDGGCTSCATQPYDGFIVAEYEYGYATPPTYGVIPETKPRYHLPSQYWDAETDFNENGARYYDPLSARYLSTESIFDNPIWIRAYAKRGGLLNPYSYAGDNPLHWVDGNGRWYVGPPPSVFGPLLAPLGVFLLWAWSPSTGLDPCEVTNSCGGSNSSCKGNGNGNNDDKSCQDHLNACLDTPLADEPGNVPGTSRCVTCFDICRSQGQGWPKTQWDGQSCQY